MAKTDTFYIVYEGVEDGTNTEPNAFAAIEAFSDDVEDAYKKTLEGNHANKDNGLFLAKLTNVTDEQAEVLEETPDVAVKSGFEGYTVEVLKSWKSSETDWLPGALDDIEEEGEPDADGFYRPDGYADPSGVED